MPAESFRCPACGMVSYHPTDVAEGYCGNCHDFTSAISKLLLTKEAIASTRLDGDTYAVDINDWVCSHGVWISTCGEDHQGGG